MLYGSIMREAGKLHLQFTRNVDRHVVMTYREK